MAVLAECAIQWGALVDVMVLDSAVREVATVSQRPDWASQRVQKHPTYVEPLRHTNADIVDIKQLSQPDLVAACHAMQPLRGL